MFSGSTLPARRLFVFGSIFVLALASRAAHSGILWVEEAYPTAAALEMLRGQTLYRDIWFDKPPLFPAAYLLWGAATGWPLRIAGAIFVLLASASAWFCARRLWSEAEGLLAAALMAFFLTFGVPPAVMALTPDLLMAPLHLLAIGLAASGRPLGAGIAGGIAFWVNPKALLVVAACAAFSWRRLPALGAGFGIPLVAGATILQIEGALEPFRLQVWQWGSQYSSDTPFGSPVLEGLRRTLNWAGFHATLVIGAAALFVKDRRGSHWPLGVWLALSLAGVLLGSRFFPRYYFHLLPVLVVLAAGGLWRIPRKHAVALSLLLIVPLVRYGPRYVTLASDLVNHRPHRWADLALEQDSRAAAELIRHSASPSGGLLVWGYRPELFAFTGLPAATRFLDSQPLNGVLADRHLTSTHVTYPQTAERNREALYRGPIPGWIIDGLGPLNPALNVFGAQGLDRYAGLYERIGATKACVIYRRRAALPR